VNFLFGHIVGLAWYSHLDESWPKSLLSECSCLL